VPENITLLESSTARAGRLAIETRGDAITHTFDEHLLGEGPARAIAAAIADGIRQIRELAAPPTLRRRRAAGIAATALFNATGRLAAGVAAIARGQEWVISPPADRLGADLHEPGARERMIDRLIELVPALRAPIEDRRVREAIARTLGLLIRVG